MKKPLLLLVVLSILVSSNSAIFAEDLPPRPLRFPDIHQDFVVFSFAGDIWRADVVAEDAEPAEARRLTAHEGLEIFPKISPDGAWVAFSGEASGSRQVWVVPSEGGTPKQLTYYGDVGVMAPRGGWDYWVQGWTPDGKILTRCNRTPWGDRMGRYCVVDPAGGLETYLPLPEGGSASLSPDGKRLAYTPIQREFRTWKRTRGGRAQDVWIYDMEAKKSRRVTEDRGTDNLPMWIGDKIYFTSDRNNKLNLFVVDAGAAGAPRQVTNYDVWDVLWPADGPDGKIVYQNGGELHVFDTNSGTQSRLPIAIRTELPYTLPHFKEVGGQVQSASISPSGKRVAVDARGEIFSVPRKKGLTRNLSRTPEVRERGATWSPDGKSIAYFSDATGEYEIYLRGDCAGADCAESRRLTNGNDVWIDGLEFSPDSKRLAWNDQKRRLRVADVETGKITEVAKGRAGNITDYAFSPAGGRIAYTEARENGMPAIFVYSFDSGETVTLGDELIADYEPAWSSDGQYLFFISPRNYQIHFSTFEFDYVYHRSENIYVAALNPEAPPLFPFENDEEIVADDSDDEDDEKDEKDEKDDEKDEKPMPIVLDGFSERIYPLPGLNASDYGSLQAVEGALFYIQNGDDGPQLYRYDLGKRKAEKVMDGVGGYELSADGKKLLYAARGKWGVVDASPGKKAGDGKLNFSKLVLKIDPVAEWKQMFRDGWRVARDFFYDENMHGYDWDALGERYGAMAPHLGHRSELDFLFGELISELGAGHTYVGSGDEPRVERVEGGKLGGELELDPAAERYRFTRIYRGENWDSRFRSPLTEHGVDVAEGEYLLAIDGEELRGDDNPYRLLENKADTHVVLRVGDDPSGENARDVTVHTLSSEGDLRYIDWVISRIEMVDRLSDGRIGYLHLPNTAIDGNRMLQKLFYSQTRKEALIVDDRYNGGGFIPDKMISYFERRTRSFWSMRDIEGFRTPNFAHDGPKAMLINGYASSGGDALPHYFRQSGLGKLIGTRTWGGLIGISGAPPLIDGGVVLAPTFRIYDPEGNWVVENEGVEPDIEVFDLPEAIMAGGDPSIERAVEELLKELDAGGGRQPPPVPEAPNLKAN